MILFARTAIHLRDRLTRNATVTEQGNHYCKDIGGGAHTFKYAKASSLDSRDYYQTHSGPPFCSATPSSGPACHQEMILVKATKHPTEGSVHKCPQCSLNGEITYMGLTLPTLPSKKGCTTCRRHSSLSPTFLSSS